MIFVEEILFIFVGPLYYTPATSSSEPFIFVSVTRCNWKVAIGHFWSIWDGEPVGILWKYDTGEYR